MKPKLVFVEDEVDMAKNFFKRLGLKNIMQSVYLQNLEQMKQLLQNHHAKCMYWVDINLGRGRLNEGIEVIKTIRDREPDALIIVYTAYSSKKEDCYAAGANYFFRKHPTSYLNDIAKLRDMIIVLLGLLNQKEVTWEKSTTLFCEVSKIEKERNLAHLNCKNSPSSEEEFEKVFSLSHFKDKEKLFIEKSIIVRILERPGARLMSRSRSACTARRIPRSTR